TGGQIAAPVARHDVVDAAVVVLGDYNRRMTGVARREGQGHAAGQRDVVEIGDTLVVAARLAVVIEVVEDGRREREAAVRLRPGVLDHAAGETADPRLVVEHGEQRFRGAAQAGAVAHGLPRSRDAGVGGGQYAAAPDGPRRDRAVDPDAATRRLDGELLHAHDLRAQDEIVRGVAIDRQVDGARQ